MKPRFTLSNENLWELRGIYMDNINYLLGKVKDDFTLDMMNKFEELLTDINLELYRRGEFDALI
jgi:hypothetical protein